MENNTTDLTIDFTNLNSIFAQSELCQHVLLIMLLERTNAVEEVTIKDVFCHNEAGIKLFTALKSNELSKSAVDDISEIANSNDLKPDLLEITLNALTSHLSSSIAYNDVAITFDDILTINQYCIYIEGLELDDVILANDANESITIDSKNDSQAIDIEVTIDGDSYRIIDEYTAVDCVVESLNDETLCYLNTCFLNDYCDLENCTVVIDAIKETMNSEALKLVLNTSLDEIASDMIRLDGAGHCLNSYDGGNEEIYNNGDIYFYFSV